MLFDEDEQDKTRFYFLVLILQLMYNKVFQLDHWEGLGVWSCWDYEIEREEDGDEGD